MRKILMEVLGMVDEEEGEGEEGLQAWDGGVVVRLRDDMVGRNAAVRSGRRRGRSRGIIDIARLLGAELVDCCILILFLE